MSPLRVLLITTAVLASALLVRLLRREHLREKYAALWLLLLPVVMVLAIFPPIIDFLAALVGISEPPNLLFFLGSVFLLALSVRLSVEISTLEDETRSIAEEVAILRSEIEALRANKA